MPASLPDYSQPPPPLLPQPLPLPPPPPPPAPLAVGRNPGIPKEVLLFYFRLNELELERVRRTNPMAVNLTRDEITRRLALDSEQLNRYYGLPPDINGEYSPEMVDFVTTLTDGVIDLFCRW